MHPYARTLADQADQHVRRLTPRRSHMAFGTHTAPHIWCTFFGLVMWIAIYVYLLLDLMHYMDDAWSYEMDPMLAFYEPYDAWFPLKQVKLLQLYHELGLLHVQKKQQFGWTLEIIGLVVNPINMTIKMSDKSRSDLTSAIRAFIDSSSSRRRP